MGLLDPTVPTHQLGDVLLHLVESFLVDLFLLVDLHINLLHLAINAFYQVQSR
jgi:hypothetical protein